MKICELIANEVEDKNPVTYHGNTPLHYAAENGNAEIFKVLINSFRDLSIKNNRGLTPFSLAVENNHNEILNIPFKFKNDL